MQPIRIQRKRIKGFNMQELSKSINGLDCIYVGRPTKWGNPFQVTCASTPEFRAKQMERYKIMVESNIWSEPNKESIKQELKGKNLACFCKEGEPCHADILLKIANDYE